MRYLLAERGRLGYENVCVFESVTVCVTVRDSVRVCVYLSVTVCVSVCVFGSVLCVRDSVHVCVCERERWVQLCTTDTLTFSERSKPSFVHSKKCVETTWMQASFISECDTIFFNAD